MTPAKPLVCDCPAPALKVDSDRVVHCDICHRQVVSKTEAAVVRIMRAVVSTEIERVLKHLGAPLAPVEVEWIDAVEAAARFGMKPRWYRDHAAELAGEPRGTGPRPRLVFDAALLPGRIAAMRAPDSGDGRADGGDGRDEAESL